MSSPTSKGVAVVTGAAQGIGKAIALRLADDGFDVAINDISLDAKITKLREVQAEIIQKGRRCSIFPGDVSNEEDVKRMVEGAVHTLGGLDVMVANAGVCPTASVLDYTVEQWDRAFAINTRGVFLCYQYAARQMIKQGRGGRIIGCSSSLGKQALPMLSLYAATKSAIRGLTQGAALDLGKFGITVNAYAPGVVDTELSREIMGRQGNMEEVIKMNVARSAIDHIGKPEDIAGFVAYLASQESRYMTGQTVGINGGWCFD
ncbi:related to Diacetyl reductase [(S)-acetoin forming] [Armillaria ostoyae]|uniref:Related to Diacetyl reductase [(S)-acetoin forming] n=1 Tax=Armillaria ostoyae TaxID=47428 RepID=A0A284QRY2_ARMOS|nr:related to Diacetyl reductase [(S)-acetoin forming] [Armillaria ostoyae]